jgi:hypothetical protein
MRVFPHREGGWSTFLLRGLSIARAVVRRHDEDPERRTAMQFLFLLYGDEAAELAMTPEQRRAIVDEHIAFSRRLRERGAMLGGDPLVESSEAFVVRDGSVIDGPFLETKEQLGGYYLVECASREEAKTLAREVPRSPGSFVEVRPIADVG